MKAYGLGGVKVIDFHCVLFFVHGQHHQMFFHFFSFLNIVWVWCFLGIEYLYFSYFTIKIEGMKIGLMAVYEGG